MKPEKRCSPVEKLCVHKLLKKHQYHGEELVPNATYWLSTLSTHTDELMASDTSLSPETQLMHRERAKRTL